MNILSFSRMKSFNKDGRVRVILKMRLPCLEKESDGAADFNNFYERIAEGYMNLASQCPYSTERGSRPTTVSVDFFEVADEYIKKHTKLSKNGKDFAVIKRDVKINANGKIQRFEHIDIYNVKTHLFIK